MIVVIGANTAALLTKTSAAPNFFFIVPKAVATEASSDISMGRATTSIEWLKDSISLFDWDRLDAERARRTIAFGPAQAKEAAKPFVNPVSSGMRA